MLRKIKEFFKLDRNYFAEPPPKKELQPMQIVHYKGTPCYIREKFANGTYDLLTVRYLETIKGVLEKEIS